MGGRQSSQSVAPEGIALPIDLILLSLSYCTDRVHLKHAGDRYEPYSESILHYLRLSKTIQQRLVLALDHELDASVVAEGVPVTRALPIRIPQYNWRLDGWSSRYI